MAKREKGLVLDIGEGRGMIRKKAGKFYIYSKDGRKIISRPYDTMAEAQERLAQMEQFKKKKRIPPE